MKKIHYAGRDKTNESTMVEVWYETLCGLRYTESPLTDDANEVTCKKCLKKIQKNRSNIIPDLTDWHEKE